MLSSDGQEGLVAAPIAVWYLVVTAMAWRTGFCNANFVNMRLESGIGDRFMVKMQGYQDVPGGFVSERHWIVICLGGHGQQ